MANEDRKKLTRDERKAQCKSFIASEEFGWDTWLTIHVFNENVKDVIVTMHLYNDMLKYLDQGFLPAKFPQQQMLRFKQHIVLDLILKAQIIVESSLIFIHELSNGYRKLSYTMARYNNYDVKNVTRKVWDKDFPLLPALGLPSLDSLPLEQQERDLLEPHYDKTERYAWDHLGKLADFYDKFKTVYHKYKHGLILRSGSTPSTTNNDNSNPAFILEKSALQAIDRKKENDLPRDCMRVDSDDVLIPGMFNSISHVNFGQKIIDEIFAIVDIVEKIVVYVFLNHKLYALNCGQSYLPFGLKDQKPYPAFLPLETSLEGHEEALESVVNKIYQQMNVQPDVTGEEFTYKNLSLVKAIENNTVTNIFVRSKALEEKVPD